MENKDDILIEAFLEGSMGEEQRREFEERLKREPQLLTQVNLHQEVDQRLETFHKEALQSEWKQYVEANPASIQSGRKVPIRTIGIIGIAATLLLLLWLSPLKNMLINNDPYRDYFAHLPRDNANLSAAAVDGKKAYDELKYGEAYPALIQEVADGADSLNLIYASVAAIGSRQSEKAIPILEPLLGAANWQVYQAEIQWYLALAYLQEEEIIKGKNLLRQLTSTQNQYASKAAELLELSK